MKHAKLARMIRATKGKVFTATFTKKDGTVRRMNARLGVRKNVKGVGLKFKPADKGLITVFDMQKDEHRMINLATLQEFTCGKTHWRK